MLWGLLFGNETAEVSSVTELPPVPPVQSKKNQKKVSVAMNSIREYKSNRKSSITAFCKYAGQRLADLLLESAKDTGVLKISACVPDIAKGSDLYSDLFGYSIGFTGLSLTDSEINHIQSVIKVHMDSLGTECALSGKTITVSVLPVMPGMDSIDFQQPMSVGKTDYVSKVFTNYSEYLSTQSHLVDILITKGQEHSVSTVIALAKTTGMNSYDYQIDINGLDQVNAEKVISGITEYLRSEGFTVNVKSTSGLICVSFAAPHGIWYYDTEKSAWCKE